MADRSTHWSAAVAAALWFVFFLALIFRPDLVVHYPALAGIAIGGVIWWAIQARRTRRREKQDLPRLDDLQ